MHSPDRWYDEDFLTSIVGDFNTHPPLKVLLFAHVRRISLLLKVKVEEGEIVIWVKKGTIVDCEGIPGLLRGGDPSSTSMGELIGNAIGTGMDPQEAMRQAGEGLGRFMILFNKSEGAQIQTETYQKPTVPVRIPMTVPQIIGHGVKEVHDEESLLAELGPRMRKKVVSQIPDVADVMQFGLPPIALRLLRNLGEGVRLQKLLGSISDVGPAWYAIVLLENLGLITLTGAASSQPQKEDKSASATSQAKSDSKESASPDSKEAEKRLRKTLKEWKDQEPYQIMALTSPRDVNDVVIDQKFRRLSSDYHPDRFVSYGDEVQLCAQRCFEHLNEVYNLLKSEEMRNELKLRLDAEERGDKYISDSDKNRSDLLYAQAQFLFRKRKWEAAHGLYSQAFGLNPKNWRCELMLLRSSVATEELTRIEAAEKMLEIESLKGNEKIEAMSVASELLVKGTEEKEKKRAKEILYSILELRPDDSAAKRHLRVLGSKNKRVGKVKEEEKKGFFSGIFRRK
jgi:tetratricopeptide (TPR) repeat protein